MDEKIFELTKEDLVIKTIFDDVSIRNKVINHLDINDFSNPNNKLIVGKLIGGFNLLKRTPTDQEIIVSSPESDPSRNHLIKIMSTRVDKIDKLYTNKLIQDFFVERRTQNVLLNAAEAINTRNFDDMPSLVEDLHKAVNFSLHMDIGVNASRDVGIILDRLNQPYSCIPASFEDIRRYTGKKGKQGGYYKKALSIVQGQVNVGKSIVLCNEASFAYQHGYNVLYVSLEMAEEKVWERVAANITDIALFDLAGESAEKIKQLMSTALDDSGVGELYIKKLPTTTTVNEIESLMSEIYLADGVEFDLVVVDYLGIMKAAKRAHSISAANQNSHFMYKEIAEQLRDLADRRNVALLTAIQYGKDGYDTTNVSMKNIPGSVGIGETADLIFTINQDPTMKAFSILMHVILKNREGKNGVTFHSHVDYSRMKVRPPSAEILSEMQQSIGLNQIN
jgi:replicative DNA helicase